MSRRLLVVLLLVAAGAAGATAGGVLGGAERPAGGEPGPQSAGRVMKVVDGDTIHVQVGATRENVRYIGVDTIVLWSRRVIPSTLAPAQRR